MNNKTIERVIKATINWNKGLVQFDKSFLEYQDDFDLIIEEKNNIITLTTKLK